MTDIKENALFAEDKEVVKNESEKSPSKEEIDELRAEDGKTESQLPVSNDSPDIAEPDGDDTANDELALANQTIKSLRENIEDLRSKIKELEDLKKGYDRMLSEVGDFTDLFPEIPIEEIPDSVWENVKNGASLAASYALYEKRMAAEAVRIAKINAKNASRSPGSAGTDTAGEYFSPEDVRRMSRSEVHANYSKIKESMKKWMQK